MIMKLSNMLNSASVFAASKDVRYYLNGVNVNHKDGAVCAIASTDGHCMQLLVNNLPFAVNLANYESFIVSNNDCKRLSSIFALDDVDDISVESILSHIDPIDGNYPDVRRVIPTECAGSDELEIGIDYKYLAKISSSMTKLGKGIKVKYNGAKFKFRGASKAIRIEIDQPAFNGVKALIVIMPMRL